MLKNNRNITLRDCINAIRKQERELMMERYEKRKRRFNNMRRKKDQRDEEDDIEPSTKIRKLCGTLETNEGGFLRLPVNEWKDLPNEDKRFIQRYNAKVKHNIMKIYQSWLFQMELLLKVRLEEIKSMKKMVIRRKKELPSI